MRIRSLRADATTEIDLVASRMHATLVEVLGERRARELYTDAELRERVRWHLDGKDGRRARVFLAEAGTGEVVGHSIVRVEPEDGLELGLFSTTYVAPSHRRAGVASELIRAGERWMREQGMDRSVTYTDVGNDKLVALFASHGYHATPVDDEWVRLTKDL